MPFPFLVYLFQWNNEKLTSININFFAFLSLHISYRAYNSLLPFFFIRTFERLIELQHPPLYKLDEQCERPSYPSFTSLFKGPFHSSEVSTPPPLFRRSFLCPILARMSSIRMYIQPRNVPSTISFRQSVSLMFLANAVESSTCLFPSRYLSRHVVHPRCSLADRRVHMPTVFYNSKTAF